MDHQILREQQAYYRARAGEYDATAYPDRARDERRIDAVVSAAAPLGDVLELACGTGMWTRALAASAESITAVDQSPEVIEIARTRCPDSLRFVEADLMTWTSDQRFDVVFFAFWLSHVSSADMAPFFARVRTFLRPGGRAVFVDESSVATPQGALDGEIEMRTMLDGSEHRIVKVYRDATRLTKELADLGWRATFTTDHAWVIGEAYPV